VGAVVDVAPGDIANTVFDVGTLGGTDQLWAQLLQDNGQLTGWQLFTVTAPAAQLPTLAVHNFAADTGMLQLDNSASFSGTVAGMTGSDTIDFADIDPTKVQTPSYAGDASGGTLSVTDGAHSANIALLGNYLASSFTTSPDGRGGTTVTDPAVLGGVAPLVIPPHA
jgi:hypothetical protein